MRALTATLPPLVLLSAVACAGDSDAEPTSEALAVYNADDSPNGDSALLYGRLTHQDGCIYIEDADDQLWAPIFPDNEATLRVDEDGIALQYGMGNYQEGQAIEVAGDGSGEVEQVRADPDIQALISEACDDQVSAWIVAPSDAMS